MAARIKMLDKVIVANEEFKIYATDDYYNNILKDVAATDLSTKIKRQFRLGFENGGKKNKQIALVKIIRNSEIEVCRLFRNQLILLDDNMENWSWDSATENIQFTDQNLQEKYNVISNSLQTAVEKQVSAQREAFQNK